MSVSARHPLRRSAGLAVLVALAAAPVGAQSVFDRMRERATERAQTQTENEAGERVDSAVDQGVDCMFDPVACAKKVPTGTAPAGTPPAGEPGGPPGGQAGAAPAADASEWYAESQGQRVGPMPRSQLDALVVKGEVKTETLVWREGMSAWTPAGAVPDLAPVFKKVPPPLPPQRSGPPPLPSR